MRFKIGFLGAGNMAQAIIKGLIESKTATASQIFASNRSGGKLQKLQDQWGVQVCPTNEELIDAADIIVIGVKPQDFSAAIDPVASAFRDKQIVVSLAAGVRMDDLEKKLPQCRIVRAMANTPAIIQRGVIGYFSASDDAGVEATVEDLFSALGYVFRVDDEDQVEAVLVSASAGTGFVFELMLYFQDWIEERGFEPEVARKMVVETFAGASLLAAQNKDVSLEDLQNKVASRKGITAAGLQSMRELEIERLLRYSFEKSALRNQELAKS